MKKSDLKTGMCVKHRNGVVSVVMRNHYYEIYDNPIEEDILQHPLGFHKFEEINDDLTFFRRDYSRFDIVEVGLGGKGIGLLEGNKIRMLKKIWERKEETPILTLDGVDYSESTLRSLIKKATE